MVVYTIQILTLYKTLKNCVILYCDNSDDATQSTCCNIICVS